MTTSDQQDFRRTTGPALRRVRCAFLPDIHRDHDALRPEGFSAPGDKRGIVHGARVQAHLVGACPADLLDIVKRPKRAPDGERQEKPVGCTLDEPNDNAAFFLGCSNIKKYHFVGALPVVMPGQFSPGPRRPDAKESCPFYDPAVL